MDALPAMHDSAYQAMESGRLGAGIYDDIEMEAYIHDPSARPSLNAGTANLLIQRSPLHAWHANARLNTNWKQDNSSVADIGTIAHHVLLAGDTRDIVVIEADDWRTKAAKEQRDEAYARGAIPILTGKMSEVRAMVDAARAQLETSELAGIFSSGKAEQTLIYEVGDCWYRSRPDWWNREAGVMLDLKTTKASAEPNSWTRLLLGMGYDLQAQIALNGALALTKGDLTPQHFIFAVLEQDPPYALSLVGASNQMLDLAQRKLDYASQIWKQCLQTSLWPGYPSRICWAEVPEYHARGVEELIELGGQA